ncbi:hypothetical protein OAA60_01840 [Porticoccaceae bacterium]|jgi:hypothetical protein|nr:hypothetical protein [Porticoccaceae bacterium]
MSLTENNNILSFALTGNQTMNYYWSRLLFNHTFINLKNIKSLLKQSKSTLNMAGAINVLPTPDTAHLIVLRVHFMPVIREFLCKYMLDTHLSTITERANGYKKADYIYLLYTYLFFSKFAIRIQRLVRRHQIRNFNKLHGPAFIYRNNCVNDEDFASLQPIYEVEPYEIFSFQENSKIYAFTLVSFKDLLVHTSENKPMSSNVCVLNPYTRQIIPTDIIKQALSIYRIGQDIYHLSYCSPDSITSEREFRTPDSVVRNEASMLFSRLQYYSNHEWFLALSLEELKTFSIELTDIWDYRARLTSRRKREMYPYTGHPFFRINMSHLFSISSSINTARLVILSTINSFLSACDETDNMDVAIICVLGALTLVNDDASNALPWLYSQFRI